MGIEDVCPVCRKTFSHGEEWGYVCKLGKNDIRKTYLCSYPCLLKYKEKSSGKKEDHHYRCDNTFMRNVATGETLSVRQLAEKYGAFEGEVLASYDRGCNFRWLWEAVKE